jgi:hypothetical protein
MISSLFGFVFFALIALVVIVAWLKEFWDRFKNKGA